MSDLAGSIKNLEERILKLKTSREYCTVMTMVASQPFRISTGLYEIVYEDSDRPILSQVCPLFSDSLSNLIYGTILDLRTPINNTQILEADTAISSDGTQVTLDVMVVSSRRVISFTKIG